MPAALEVSRSGEGAHVWVFFASRVSARDARRLGAAIISHTCARTRQLKLGSYDRLFPNQDTMPKGGFGNLIALPLQKRPRDQGRSVFVDANLQPFPDMLPKQTCGSSISSTPVTRPCSACGRSASAAIGRWGTELLLMLIARRLQRGCSEAHPSIR